MNYIDELFARANLQQIVSFLLYESDKIDLDPRPYWERLEHAAETVYRQVSVICPEREEYEKMMEALYLYVNTEEEVYLEIGLQVGLSLAMEISRNFKK